MGIGDDLGDLGNDLAGLTNGDPDAMQDLADLADGLGVPLVGDILGGINKALTENGFPPVRYRALFGEPGSGTVTTAELTLQSGLTQATHALDNFAGLGGKGELLGAAAEHIAGMNDGLKYDHPEWNVYSLHCTEGISQMYRCELYLVRHEWKPGDPAFDDINLWSDIDHILNPNTGPAANPNQLTGIGAAIQTVQDVLNDWNDPTGRNKTKSGRDEGLADIADVENPDEVPSPTSKYLAAGAHISYYPEHVDPTKFVGGDTLCRVSMARRMPDGFTLCERWITGIATEFEDLGYVHGTTSKNTSSMYHVARVVIVPQLWRLSLRTNCRVFQNKTAVEIIQDVLKEHDAYNRDGRWELKLKPPGKSLVGGLHIPDALASAVPGGLLAEDASSWGPKRELCVQYNESDLDFVFRLMEEEGISYHFEHYERRSVLVLSDDPKFAGKQTKAINRKPYPVLQADPASQPGECAGALGVNRRLVPNKVTLRDYNYSFPNRVTELLGGHQTPSLTGGTNILTRAVELVQSTVLDDHKDYGDSDTRVFEYPGYFVLLPDEDEGADGGTYRHYQDPNLAEFRMDVIRGAEAVAEGESNISNLTPANHADMLGGFDVNQPDTIDPQRFLVTVVEHRAFTPPSATGGATYDNPAPSYRNRFQCVNAAKVRIRPARRTPRPVITGLQTATVLDSKAHGMVDSASSEITTDAFGRVYVRLHWDRRKRPDLDQTASSRVPNTKDPLPASTCWVRVAQSYAGSQFGTHFIPRVGMEVILHFLEGNPDRPVVVGCLYNGFEGVNTHAYHEPDESARAVPIDTEGQQVRSIIKTRTVARTNPQGWNAIRLDDHGSFEEILVRTEGDLVKDVHGDHVTSVRVNQRNIVGGDEPKQTSERPNNPGSGDQLEEILTDQALLVTEEAPDDHAVTREKTLHANEKVFVGEDPTNHHRNEEVAGNELIEIKKTRIDRVSQNETIVIDGKPEIPPFGPPHPVAAAAGNPTAQTSNPEAAAAGHPAAAQTYARTLSVYGSNHVWVTRTDTTEVKKGDRLTDVKGALVVNAQSISMLPLDDDGDAVKEGQSGVGVDDEGVKLNAEKSAEITARNVLFQSKNGKVLVKARQIIQLRAGHKTVLTLNANTGVIHIHADEHGGIKFGTADKYISMTSEHITWKVGPSAYSTVKQGKDGLNTSVDVSGNLEIAADGEVHFNADSVNVAPTANGVVDGDKGLPSSQDPDKVETPVLKKPGEQGVDPNAPPPAKLPEEPQPGLNTAPPDNNTTPPETTTAPPG